MTRRTADESRAAIADAARSLFAAEGYERATIRAIAARAGIDPAMVMRYFGSKEELFTSVVDREIAELEAQIPGDPDRIGEFIVRNVLTRWEGDDLFLIILRTALDDERMLARLREDVLMRQVAPMLARIGVPPDETAVRASLVASQAVGLMLLRLVGRIEPLASADPEDVVRWYAPTFQRYATGTL